LFSRYQINALQHLVDSVAPSFDKIWSDDHIYRLGGLKDRFCNPEALPQAVISDPFGQAMPAAQGLLKV